MLPVMLSQRLSVVFFREDTAPRPGMPGRRPQIFEPAGTGYLASGDRSFHWAP
jgi:hypothetical protein